MANIVTANQKGGVGKTAIAVQLAHSLQRETGGKVLFVDADKQQSAFKHFRRRKMDGGLGDIPFVLTACANEDIHLRVPPLVKAGGFHHCIVDCPAGDSNITRSALAMADLVIVPVRPSPVDFDASEELVPIFRGITKMNPNLQVLVVISCKRNGNAFSREAREAALHFFTQEGINVTVAHQEIGDRVEMVRSYAEGKTLFEYSSPGVTAGEITRLSEEVLQCLQPQAVAA